MTKFSVANGPPLLFAMLLAFAVCVCLAGCNGTPAVQETPAVTTVNEIDSTSAAQETPAAATTANEIDSTPAETPAVTTTANKTDSTPAETPAAATKSEESKATDLTESVTTPEPPAVNEPSLYFAGLQFEKDITVAKAAGLPYARMYVLKDERFFCAWPGTDNGKRCMWGVFSSDDGLTWTNPEVLFYGEDQTKTLGNVDIIQLESGQILIAYRSNDKEAVDGVFYSSIRVHASDDNAKTFYQHSFVAETTWTEGKKVGYWEPCFCMLNGELSCFITVSRDVYENPVIPSTDIYTWKNDKWERAHYTSDDTGKTDRNGMTIVRELSGGGYLLSVETKRFYESTKSVLLSYLLYSADGVHWAGLTGTHFPANGATNGAPFWVELPDGRIVVAFQTDEDIKGTQLWESNDNVKVTKLVVSEKGVPVSELKADDFSEAFNPFGTPQGKGAIWPGMLIHGDYLYIYSGTNYPTNRIVMSRCYIGDLK